MTFWRKNWYYIGGILFVLLAFIMGLLPPGHNSDHPGIQLDGNAYASV